MEELLQSRWSPSITCADIINKLPNFYSTQILPSQENLFSINFGKFHLGSPYLLDLWYSKENMGCFHCTENDLNNTNYVKERMIVVTHTLILIFELNTQIIDVGYLLSWATIQSLGSIKRTMNEPDRLTFEWKKIGNNEAFSQQFKVPGANALIELISKNVKRIMALSREKESKKVFKEEEVTGKVIKNMKIADVLDDISILEKVLEKKLDLHGINQLMEMYQHVIEYFTAIGDMEFQVYLKKMHKLLSDEKVVSVLQGGEEVKINKDAPKSSELSKNETSVLEQEEVSQNKKDDGSEKLIHKAEVTEDANRKPDIAGKKSDFEHHDYGKTEPSLKIDSVHEVSPIEITHKNDSESNLIHSPERREKNSEVPETEELKDADENIETGKKMESEGLSEKEEKKETENEKEVDLIVEKLNIKEVNSEDES